MILDLRTCNRPFFVNIFDFKNVPPDHFSCVFSAPDRIPPGEWSSRILGPKYIANITLETWGARVEEPSNFHLHEYLVYRRSWPAPLDFGSSFLGDLGHAKTILRNDFGPGCDLRR